MEPKSFRHTVCDKYFILLLLGNLLFSYVSTLPLKNGNLCPVALYGQESGCVTLHIPYSAKA